jgi:cytochrome c peroxidase
MVNHQTKRVGPFSPTELDNMLAFLDSLTGEIPTDYIAKPELPPLGDGKPIEVKAEKPAEEKPAEGEEPKPKKPKQPEGEPAAP